MHAGDGVAVTRLWLTDFRCFASAEFEPEPTGLTVLRGENGAGKTSVLEAVGWLATQKSFRGAQRDALVRTGASRSVVRAEVRHPARSVLLEAELPVSGAVRVQVNRQPSRRRAELSDALRVSVFCPEDLDVVQGSPGRRRDFLDDVLVARHPRLEALVSDLDRVLRQRGALLRQSGRHADAEIRSTLDVWDGRLAETGEALVAAREELAADLTPFVSDAYAGLSGRDDKVVLAYRRSWTGPLIDALARARTDDLRRQATTVGPHRDELDVTISGRPARTHSSQGEQRSAALALRLGAHQLHTSEYGSAPVLLLDDVFSELDSRRSSALVAQLPAGQVLLTTAVDPPPVVHPARVVYVHDGTLGRAGDHL